MVESQTFMTRGSFGDYTNYLFILETRKWMPRVVKGSEVTLKRFLSTLFGVVVTRHYSGGSSLFSLLSWLSLITPSCRPMKLCLSFHLAPSQRSTLSGVPPALGTGRMALLQHGSFIAAPRCLRAAQKALTSGLPLSDPAELPN